MKTNLKTIAVMALLSAGLIAGCKKEQGTTANQPYVAYKVTDQMQVNNQDGMPRPTTTLPVLNGETVALNSEDINRGQVTLKNSLGDGVLLTVAENADGKLTLAQKYAAANGMASGVIYYGLNRE